VGLEQCFLLRVLGILLITRDSEGQPKSTLLAILQNVWAHRSFAFLPKTCGD
jgi:hypothetical protein